MLVKGDFLCKPQGVVNVKGKGEMEVWYVTGQKNNPAKINTSVSPQIQAPGLNTRETK